VEPGRRVDWRDCVRKLKAGQRVRKPLSRPLLKLTSTCAGIKYRTDSRDNQGKGDQDNTQDCRRMTELLHD